jgi:hypothetical protein
MQRAANLAACPLIASLPLLCADTTYPGGVTLQGTGLDFSSDAAVVKESIALLKQRNPYTKVAPTAHRRRVPTCLLRPSGSGREARTLTWGSLDRNLPGTLQVLVAVGGATYLNWAALNAPAIAAFIQEFGLDGADIDFEPSYAGRPLECGTRGEGWGEGTSSATQVPVGAAGCPAGLTPRHPADAWHTHLAAADTASAACPARVCRPVGSPLRPLPGMASGQAGLATACRAPPALPPAGCAKNSSGQINCVTDAENIAITKAMRAALPRPLWLTAAMWSIGERQAGALPSSPVDCRRQAWLLPLHAPTAHRPWLCLQVPMAKVQTPGGCTEAPPAAAAGSAA